MLRFRSCLVLLIRAHLCFLVDVRCLWPNCLGTHLHRKLDGARLLPHIVSVAIRLDVWASVISRSPRLVHSMDLSPPLLRLLELLDSFLHSTILVRLLLLNTAPWVVRPGYTFRRTVGTYING